MSVGSVQAKTKPPAVGQAWPEVTLTAPRDAAQRAYLGLGSVKKFKIHQVKARVVVIEVYSMYCPYCQREAPNINRLYRLIESDPSLKGKIKLIGIAAGNSVFEVAVFRKKFQVPFPLLPDLKFAAHRPLGKPRTPYFFGVLIGPGAKARVIYSKLGALGDVKSFLAGLRRAAGL
ncbi:MAG: TlpA family protein disulfide reductase [Proteobacteria bacterium]|nr:TlpA family protein disulfide reductase [Pseudomonadota bacterium]MBU1742121.1 TlpA family protein disulfide reductase [Pseudomonadota bacterium]